MKITSLRAILQTLNHNNIKYLIAGGVAVNIHGYQRLAQALEVHIISIPMLIKMKEKAGRNRDKDDIQHLSWILERIKEDEK